jgi:diacylglycerol kinase family enzyme
MYLHTVSLALSLQVLVNPNSGRKNAAIVWRSVEHLFSAAGVACDVRESTHSNHLYVLLSLISIKNACVSQPIALADMKSS